MLPEMRVRTFSVRLPPAGMLPSGPLEGFFVGLGVGVAAVYQPSRAGPTGGTPRELSPIRELAFLTCHVRMGHGSRTSAICQVAPGGPREPPGLVARNGPEWFQNCFFARFPPGPPAEALSLIHI